MAKHLGSGRWHLSLASAHRGLARCAVGVEPHLWSVVVGHTFSLSERYQNVSFSRIPTVLRLRTLVIRSDLCTHLTSCVREPPS
jgi:hypothetical protein